MNSVKLLMELGVTQCVSGFSVGQGFKVSQSQGRFKGAPEKGTLGFNGRDEEDWNSGESSYR